MNGLRYGIVIDADSRGAQQGVRELGGAVREVAKAGDALAPLKQQLAEVSKLGQAAGRSSVGAAIAKDIREASKAAAAGNTEAARAILATAEANKAGATAAFQAARAADTATGGTERQRQALRDLATAHAAVKAAQDAVEAASRVAARQDNVRATQAEAAALRDAAAAAETYAQRQSQMAAATRSARDGSLTAGAAALARDIKTAAKAAADGSIEAAEATLAAAKANREGAVAALQMARAMDNATGGTERQREALRELAAAHQLVNAAQSVVDTARSASVRAEAAQRTEQEARALREAADAQARYNQLLGVRPANDDSYAGRTAELEAWSREIDALRAKYVPFEAQILEARQAVEALEQAQRLGVLTAEEAAAAQKRLGDAAGRLREEFLPLDAVSRRYQEQLERVEQAVRSGIITEREAIAVRQRLKVEHERAAKAAEAAADGYRGAGGAAQNAGFQLADFAGQVQAGTSAVTALAQQLPQLLGGFGVWGALAGAAVAVGALVFSLLGLGPAAQKAEESTRRLDAAVASFGPTLEEEKGRLDEIIKKYNQATEARRAYAKAEIQDAVEKDTKALAALSRELEAIARRAGSRAYSYTGAGTLVVDEKALQVARELDRLLANKDYQGFVQALRNAGTSYKGLASDALEAAKAIDEVSGNVTRGKQALDVFASGLALSGELAAELARALPGVMSQLERSFGDRIAADFDGIVTASGKALQGLKDYNQLVRVAAPLQEALARAQGGTGAELDAAARKLAVFNEAVRRYDLAVAAAVAAGEPLPSDLREFAAALERLDLIKRATEVKRYSEQVALQTEAQERLAAAAGQGEAAQRAAAAANEVAAASARSAAEGAIVQAEQERRKAATVKGLTSELVAGMQAEAAANQRATAALKQGGQAAALAAREEYRLAQQRRLGVDAVEELTRVMQAYDALMQSQQERAEAGEDGQRLRDLRDELKLLERRNKLLAEQARGGAAGRAAGAAVARLDIEAQIDEKVLQRQRELLALSKQVQGINVETETLKYRFALEDQARLEHQIETQALAAQAAGTLGNLFTRIESGDWGSVAEGIGDFMTEFRALETQTGSAAEAFAALGEQMLDSAEAGSALGDLVGELFGGRSEAQNRNAKIGATVATTVGDFFGVPKGISSFVGNVIGGLFGPGKSDSTAGVEITPSSGRAVNYDTKASKQDSGNMSARDALADSVQQFAKLLKDFTGGTLSDRVAIEVGSRDGNRWRVYGQDGQLAASGTAAVGDTEGTLGQVLAAITSTLAGVPEELKARLQAIDFSNLTRAESDLQFVLNYRTAIATLNGTLEGGADAVQTARQNVIDLLNKVRDFGAQAARLGYDTAETAAALRASVERFAGITAAAMPMTELETKVAALKASFAELAPVLEAVGYTATDAAAAVTAAQARQLGALKADFEAGLTRELRDLTGKGYLNQIDDLTRQRDLRYRDADAVGASRAGVDTNFSAGLDSIFGGLDLTALQDIQTQFAAGTPVYEAAGRAISKLNGAVGTVIETAEQAAARIAATAALSDSLADRRARATGAADTEVGALAIFDRAATAERAATQARINAGELTASILTELETTLGAERAAIIRRFNDQATELERQRAERLAGINQSISDRLFAATTDTTTQAGALAAFDRQVGRERAEIARNAGLDLVAYDAASAADRVLMARAAGVDMAKLDEALGVERLAIIKRFNDEATALERQRAEQLAGINQSISDRIFAATTDTTTQAGALAAFDRQVGRERAEIARNAGLDLVAYDAASAADRVLMARAAGIDMTRLDEALGAERLAIIHRFADEAAEAERQRLEQLASVNQSIGDRLFTATNDTSTLAGRLSAFDRQAAREREEAARTDGADLVKLEQAFGAERAAIIKRYNDEVAEAERQRLEQLASVNQSIGDRLFAATNDASTLVGALAAFDRQASRDRIEAGRTAGADLAGLERAIGAERAAIIKQFNDRAIEDAQAAVERSRGDLVNALTREADAARTLANSWRQAGQAIRQSLNADQLSDRYSSLNPEQAATLAEQELRRLAARAQDQTLSAEERTAAAAALPEARRAFLDAVRPLYEGTERWGQALMMSNDLLQSVASITDQQADTAERAVRVAEQQLAALGTLDQSVQTVAQALASYQQALLELERARTMPVSAPASAVNDNVTMPAQPANNNARTDARAALAATVARTTSLGDTSILSWNRPGGGAIALTTQDLATRPQEYLAEIARQAGIPGFQRGGMIGNGLFDVDSVLARYQGGGAVALAGGEWVTRATSVTADTAPVLRAINETGRLPALTLPGRDDAGVVRAIQQLARVVEAQGRRQADLDAQGYGTLADGIGRLVSQGGDAATDKRRVAR